MNIKPVEGKLSGEPLREPSEDRKKELIKKLDWIRDRQLSFLGLFFTSLIGLVGLYPHIPTYNMWPYNLSIIGFYFFLIYLMCVSVKQISIYGVDLISWQLELDQNYKWSWKWHREGLTPGYFNLFIVKDTVVKVNKVRLWAYYIVIFISFSFMFLEQLGIFKGIIDFILDP